MYRTRVQLKHSKEFYQREPMWFWLFIHDTIDDYNTGVGKTQPGSEGLFGPTVGCVQPNYGTTNYCGVIRLLQGHLSPWVIAHEALHASFVVYRNSRLPDNTFLRGEAFSLLSEEYLSFIMGDISTAVYEELGRLTVLKTDGIL